MSELRKEWRIIKGYEGLYEVSNLGQIKTLSKDILSGLNKGTLKRHVKSSIKK